MDETLARRQLGPALVTLAVMLPALVLAWYLVGPVLIRPGTGGYDIDRMVLFYSTLPRLATALIAGAALALSGTLFQQVLRNPLASPTTLGIFAGANLALALATLYFPALLGLGRDVVALGGSAIATAVVMAIGARRGFSPFSLVLSGMVISFWCGALSAILTLLNDRYLVSLYIWGAGSLAQQSWDTPLSLLAKVGALALVCALLVRPLALLDLGEGPASALGVKIARLRILSVSVAVALAAFVTSAVGVIGFIGLVSPTICRLAGARRPAELLIWSSLVGAGLLLLADVSVQHLAGSISDFLPTGAVTAVLGSPLLLLLLPRLKIRHRLLPSSIQFTRHIASNGKICAVSFAIVLLAVVIALFFGRASMAAGTG